MMIFVAGFVDCIAGGGGLISLPAYMIIGLPAHTAIATNKMSSSMGTTVSTFRFIRKGYINYKLGAVCILLALIGSAAGANIALMIPADFFTKIMLVILPITAFYVLRPKSLRDDLPPLSFHKTMFLAGVSALVIGVYDGFYGPGTGTFLILLLNGLAHLSLKEANGITKIINLTTNLTSLAVYIYHGKTWILLGMCAGIFGILGNWMGTIFFEKDTQKIVRSVMTSVIVIFFVRTLSTLF